MSSHRPRKRFGQHFLRDRGVIENIIEVVHAQATDVLLEIGPGEGVLTHRLAEQCLQLHAIEIDRDLARSLIDHYADQAKVHIHQMDALQFDICSVAPDQQKLRLVGNLPYNVSTPLLFHFLRHASCIQDMHFMLQKEVVDRLVAEPGNKSYGRLSVITQLLCETESLFDIGPEAFQPPPKVWSSVIRMIPRETPMISAQQIPRLEQLTQRVFSQRRKTLRKILQGSVTAGELDSAGIESSRRPETLTLEEFMTLLELVSRAGKPVLDCLS